VATKETIARAMRLLFANWPDQQRGKATTELYYQMLRDLPDETIEAAVRQRLASANPFFPRVGEIRQLAIDIASGADSVLPAPEAWGKLLKWIRRYGGGYQYWTASGPTDPPQLPALVKKAAAAIGGVSYIGMSENLTADRARFIEAYDIFVQRERSRIGMLPEVREARRVLAGERARLLGDGLRDDHESMLAEERARPFDTGDGDGD
jgi:hypothetical protein